VKPTFLILAAVEQSNFQRPGSLIVQQVMPPANQGISAEQHLYGDLPDNRLALSVNGPKQKKIWGEKS